MKQKEVKVTFYLKKSETNDEGRCPVMAQLTIGKYSEVAFSAKMLVPVSLWSSGRAAGKSREAAEINSQLDEIRASALTIYRELSTRREQVTAEDVRSALLGMAFGQETLLSYYHAHNLDFDKHVGINRVKGTARLYWNALNHVTTFLKKEYKQTDVPFTALNRSFIDKFDLYMRTEVKLAPSTIIGMTTRLRTIIGKAITDGIITADPFAGYEPQRPERVRRYLTREELERLMTTPLDKKYLYRIRDLFLFSCYTGIPYGDMCHLTPNDIEIAEDGQVWIKTYREKTKINYEIPLLELPLYILEKYKNTSRKGLLLPMFRNSDMNYQLKLLAQACNIDRKLTFHMGRHTYATLITLSQGVPLETVSKMLGHSQIRTTQIYAQVTDNKIETDTQALNERIAGEFSVVI